MSATLISLIVTVVGGAGMLAISWYICKDDTKKGEKENGRKETDR